MKKLKEKTVQESMVETNNLVLPSDANAVGTIFGGTIMSWIDICAALCAQKHANQICVTANVDTLHFLSPVFVGDMVNLKARVVYTGNTSMTIAVDVKAENPIKSEKRYCVFAFLTFIALGKDRKSVPVPPLKIETSQQRKEFKEAELRKKALVKQRAEIETLKGKN